ncbi:MAG: hypothetical protein K0R83_2970 [Caulobacter sp.]|jgi:prepilin-type N-terminal cleavage/methylation domain-containing protein|nr:hypothetical protein [Caulobacter sp.]
MTRPRPPNGYTLVEMLAALLVLGLAMTALVQTTRTFAQTSQRTSMAISKVDSARTVETFLLRQLGSGPFASAADGSEAVLQGDEQHVRYRCVTGSCELAVRDMPSPRLEAGDGRSVPLPAPGLRFRFISSDAASAVFPQGDAEDRLAAIALVDPRGSAFAVWRTATQQSAGCAFDDVNHRCFPAPNPSSR